MIGGEEREMRGGAAEGEEVSLEKMKRESESESVG